MTADRLRVFVVEDQRVIAAELKHILKKLGYDVVGLAQSGEDAIGRVLELKPDLVLMDIELKGELDGIGAALAIRQQLDVPVIYVSSYDDQATIDRAKLTSPGGYVVKPFSVRDLRITLEIALYKRESEQRLAEERAVRKAAEEFQALVDTVKDYAVFKLDLEGRVHSWNDGARRMTGYVEAEILGKHIAIFHPPVSLLESINQELQTATTCGRSIHEGWRIRKDGSQFWAHIVTLPLRTPEGIVHGFAKVTRDLTEQKIRDDAQHFLDQATVRLTSVLDVNETAQRAAELSVPVLGDLCFIDLKNEKGRLVHVSAAHSDPRLDGMMQVLKHNVQARHDIEHGAAQVFQTQTAEVFPPLTQSGWNWQSVSPDASALLKMLDVRSYMRVPIPYQGRCQGVLTVLRSIPPRRYTAQELSVAEEFARRVGLAIDNSRLFHEAKEAVRARDEFLSIASHELKTPLTPLQLQLRGLEARVSEVARDAQASTWLDGWLQSVKRQGNRMERLVDELLDVSRITGEGLRLELEQLDASGLVSAIVRRALDSGQAQRAHCAVSVSIEPGVVGKFDRLRLEQVVTHLLENAFKFGAGKPVEVRFAKAENIASLVVVDHGIGIATDDQARIFERFERAVPERHFGGLGLGLWIVRQLIVAMSGSIEVRSEPQCGAQFTVHLPLMSEVETAPLLRPNESAASSPARSHV